MLTPWGLRGGRRLPAERDRAADGAGLQAGRRLLLRGQHGRQLVRPAARAAPCLRGGRMPAVPWLARPCSPARVRLLCADAVRQTEACCLTVACALPRSYQCGVYPGNYSRFTSDWTQVYQTAYTPTIAPLPWFSVFGAHTLQEDRAVRGWESFVSRQLWDPHVTAPAVHGAAARAPTAAWAGCSADDVTLRRAGNHDIVINGAAPARAAHRPLPPPPSVPPRAAHCPCCAACSAPTVLFQLPRTSCCATHARLPSL